MAARGGGACVEGFSEGFSRGMIGGIIGGYDKMTMCNYGATPGNSDNAQMPNHMEIGV